MTDADVPATTATDTFPAFSADDFRRITSEMYAKNRELADINKTLSLLRSIDLAVLRQSYDMQSICQRICELITEGYSDCVFSAIYVTSGTESMQLLRGFALRPLSDNSVATDLMTQLQKLHFVPTPEVHEGQHTDIVTLRATHASSEIIDDRRSMVHFIEKQFASHDVYIARLVNAQQVMGTVLICLPMDENVRKDRLLDRVVEAVSIALDNKLLQDENARILRKLTETNEKLKTMDETKDEFISMASHQLRTPLTSVKGYVSMVLDGDAGDVNDMQRKLLDQAFVSSQRMVFLIADLLNVSRLRTGKFVIESAPVNLADVIAGEVDQLSETAKTRGLKLEYKKPSSFPTLLFDETKMRQVIMNFMDNAIYYTPSGGTIRIVLRETPRTIEFLVEDDGIGVPKTEQHHLFTKFYRAGNARKARPDGTGLGLFMAKKVVVAQKGAIIFKSSEGKGSTFGFSFAKAQHALPDKA